MYQEKFTIIMNFKEIIKQEWEEEFNPGEYEEPVEPYGFESSIFQMYNSMVERICIKVWNQAVEDCAATGYNFGNGVETEQAIFKLLIDEQGTNTTEI